MAQRTASLKRAGLSDGLSLHDPWYEVFVPMDWVYRTVLDPDSIWDLAVKILLLA